MKRFTHRGYMLIVQLILNEPIGIISNNYEIYIQFGNKLGFFDDKIDHEESEYEYTGAMVNPGTWMGSIFSNN